MTASVCGVVICQTVVFINIDIFGIQLCSNELVDYQSTI